MGACRGVPRSPTAMPWSRSMPSSRGAISSACASMPRPIATASTSTCAPAAARAACWRDFPASGARSRLRSPVTAAGPIGRAAPWPAPATRRSSISRLATAPAPTRSAACWPPAASPAASFSASPPRVYASRAPAPSSIAGSTADCPPARRRSRSRPPALPIWAKARGATCASARGCCGPPRYSPI